MIWIASTIVIFLILAGVAIATNGNVLDLLASLLLLIPISFFVDIYLFMKLLNVKAFKAVVLVIFALLIASILNLLGFEVVSWATPLFGIIIASYVRGQVKYFDK